MHEDFGKSRPGDNHNDQGDRGVCSSDRMCPDSGGHGKSITDRASEGGVVLEFPTSQDKRAEGLSRRLVELELTEHRKDLSVFQAAYDSIRRRIREVKDDSRLMALVNWSGTAAVMGSLELSIHAMERVVDELKDILKRIDSGAVYNLDQEEDNV